MADDDQWVAVFTDVQGNNLDEFVRCVCIEGPEQFVERLGDKDRSLQNPQYLYSLRIEGLVRKAYLISVDLFEIAIERYYQYITECMRNPDDQDSIPPYFSKNCLDGDIHRLVERDLIFRATMGDFEQMEKEALIDTSTHGRLVLEEMDLDCARAIISRSYDRDSLVFTFEKGECVLRNSSFKPFEIAFEKNKEFRERTCKFILWAIFSGSISNLWTQYSHEGGVYMTTIELLYQSGRDYLEQFGDDLLSQFVDGVLVSGMSIRVRMTLDELLGKGVSIDNVVVPRSIVEYVLARKAEPPFFIPRSDIEGEKTDLQ